MVPFACPRFHSDAPVRMTSWVARSSMCNSMLRRAATGSDRLLPRMVLTRSCKERVDWPSWPTSCVDCEQPGRHQDVFPRFCLVRWLPALTAVSRACTLSDYFPTAIVKSRPNQLLAEWLLGWFRSEVLSAGDLVTANGLELSCSFLGVSTKLCASSSDGLSMAWL